MSRMIVPSLTLLAFLAAPVMVRAGGDLKAYQAKQKVAVDKIYYQVDTVLDRAKTLTKTDPGAAKELVQNTMRQVRDSLDLNEAQRNQLTSRLRLRLDMVEEALATRRVSQEQKPYERPKPRTGGSEPPPGSGAAYAKDFIGGGKSIQDAQREYIRIREQNVRAALAGIEKTPVYPTDDRPVVFPADWAKKKPFGPQLTAREIALLKTLNSVMSVDYSDTKFRDVMNHIQEKTGLTLIIDEASLKDAMVDYDDPITFKINKATVRTILKKVLGDKGLSYIIKEGMVQVMTPKKASEFLVMRTYPVSDLVAPSAMTTNLYGPVGAAMESRQKAAQLIGLIMSFEPNYWQPNGPGSIFYLDATQSLVVRASAEMHYSLGAPNLFGR